MLIILFCSTDVITFEEYTGQVETTVTNNHSPSLNAVKHHPSGTDMQSCIFLFMLRTCDWYWWWNLLCYNGRNVGFDTLAVECKLMSLKFVAAIMKIRRLRISEYCF